VVRYWSVLAVVSVRLKEYVPVTVVEVRGVQVLPLRRCNETLCLVSAAPLAVRVPVIEKEWLTWAEEGAEMVRAVEIFAGVTVTVTIGLFELA
jgi:hypothetical protein